MDILHNIFQSLSSFSTLQQVVVLGLFIAVGSLIILGIEITMVLVVVVFIVGIISTVLGYGPIHIPNLF